MPAYNRVEVRFAGGQTLTFRSSLEADVAKALHALGTPFDYESEVLTYTKTHRYTPDFVLRSSSGDPIFIEVKGFFSPQDRSKTIEVLRQNPGLDLRFVFERASTRLNRRSKTTYAAWCERHNLLWAEREVAEEWQNE